MTVAMVVVSHSHLLAQGVCELARQMGPDVMMAVAAGDPQGGLGSDYNAIVSAIDDALTCADQAVICADVGSAILTVESALDIGDYSPSQVALARGPFVEGIIAAVVASQQGADLDGVVAAVHHAATVWESDKAPANPPEETTATTCRRTARIHDLLGLHARPAATLARAVAATGMPITVNGVDGTSVLSLLTLGVQSEDTLTLESPAPDAESALESLAALIESFGT